MHTDFCCGSGVISAILWERIIMEFPDLLDFIDMSAGCSSGATLGMCINMYVRNVCVCMYVRVCVLV